MKILSINAEFIELRISIVILHHISSFFNTQQFTTSSREYLFYVLTRNPPPLNAGLFVFS